METSAVALMWKLAHAELSVLGSTFEAVATALLTCTRALGAPSSPIEPSIVMPVAVFQGVNPLEASSTKVPSNATSVADGRETGPIGLTLPERSDARIE